MIIRATRQRPTLKMLQTIVPACAIALVTLTACGGGGDDERTLTVCIDAPFEPMAFSDPKAESGYSGFEVDLVQAIADDMDEKLVVKDIGFDGIQSGSSLQSDQCELAAAGLYSTPEREKNLAFSGVYFTGVMSLLTAKDSTITDLDDLAKKRVAVQQGSIDATFTKENAPKTAEIVAFPGVGEAWQALQAGSVDAFVVDQIVAVEQIAANPDFHTATVFPDSGAAVAFAVKKTGSEALLEDVNTSLAALRKNGVYDELMAKYFPDAS